MGDGGWGEGRTVRALWQVELDDVVGSDKSDELLVPNRDRARRDLDEIVTHVTHNGRGWVVPHLFGDGHEANGRRRVDKEETGRSVEVETDAFAGDGGDILAPSRSQGRWCLVVERLEGGEGGGFDLHFLDGDVGGVINCVDQSGIVSKNEEL